MSQSTELLAHVIEKKAITFGEFTLKSGRISPYFFNLSCLDDAASLSMLGRACADVIVSSGIAFDQLFGLPYKGIPLVVATAVSLYQDYGLNIPYGFFRKEKKCHGEGGMVVGATPSGRVLLIDDVLTQGTAVGQSCLDLAHFSDAKPVGLVLVLDRQERIKKAMLASDHIASQYDLNVLSVLNFEDIVAYGKAVLSDSANAALTAYRATYGVGAKENANKDDSGAR
jgi:orotate phosphoribosyltransferase